MAGKKRKTKSRASRNGDESGSASPGSSSAAPSGSATGTSLNLTPKAHTNTLTSTPIHTSHMTTDVSTVTGSLPVYQTNTSHNVGFMGSNQSTESPLACSSGVMSGLHTGTTLASTNLGQSHLAFGNMCNLNTDTHTTSSSDTYKASGVHPVNLNDVFTYGSSSVNLHQNTGFVPVSSAPHLQSTGYLAVNHSSGSLPVNTMHIPNTNSMPMGYHAGLLSANSHANSPLLPLAQPLHTVYNTGYVPVTLHNTHAGFPTSTGVVPGLANTGSNSVAPVSLSLPVTSSTGFIPANMQSRWTSDGMGDRRALMGDFTTQIQQEVQKAIQNALGGYMMQPNQPLNRNMSRVEESEDSDTEDMERGIRNTRAKVSNNKFPRLPFFTGKEAWKIWFNRFDETAQRRRWNTEERLDHLLSLMMDDAAEFVYGQLDSSTRQSYHKLVAELETRFRIIETRKTYAVQFSNRSQKPGESAGDFAAELKGLYNKAYPNRDIDTKREDLLRRFLDGLSDPDAQFQVEFHKEPANIDEAVFQVVNYEETGRGHKGKTKAVRATNVQEETKPKGTGNNENWNQRKGNQMNKGQSQGNGDKATIDRLQKQIDELKREVAKNKGTQPKQEQGQPAQQNQPIRDRGNLTDKICYNCHEPGHFARECPYAHLQQNRQFQNLQGPPLNHYQLPQRVMGQLH